MTTDLGPILRVTNQVRDSIRDAGDLLRRGIHPGERLDRALKLSIALSDALTTITSGAPAPAAFAPEPPTIIGPVVPEGGDSRRLYLLEHPDVAEAERQRLAAEARGQETQRRERAGVHPDAVAAVAQQAADAAVAAYFARERQLAAEPTTELPVLPMPIPSDVFDALVGDDMLLDELAGLQRERPVQGLVLPAGYTPPPGAGPGYIPPGYIPPGEPIPAVASTFVPFDGAQLTPEQLDAAEREIAAQRGRRQEPIPFTPPGIVEDDPAEYERRVEAARAAHAAGQRVAPASGIMSNERAAAIAASLDEPEHEVIPPCPECGKVTSAWVGLGGHAAAAHGFKGNRAALMEWARAGGSSSSAA